MLCHPPAAYDMRNERDYRSNFCEFIYEPGITSEEKKKAIILNRLLRYEYMTVIVRTAFHGIFTSC